MGKCLLQGTPTYLLNHQCRKLTESYSFVLQLISLAGLHSNATIATELSRAFKDEGMLAYVRLIQAREKELGVDVLTHQKWSGAPYIDGILGAIQSGSSSSKSMGEGNTEKGKFPWR